LQAKAAAKAAIPRMVATPTTKKAAAVTTLALPSTPPLMSAAVDGGEAAALSGDAAARFGSRNETMYPFLTASQRRDGQGRRPEHPDYDAATLQLPSSFPTIVLGSGEKKTLSGGQAQWWVASGTLTLALTLHLIRL
jgi:hypothetical protein